MASRSINALAGDQCVAHVMKVTTAEEDRAVTGRQRTVKHLREFAVRAHAAAEADALLPRA